MKKFLQLFIFPRSDLEVKWWHRMFKVFIIISTITVFIFSIRWTNEIFKPYYIYSFSKDFNNYDYKVKNWADINPSYSDTEDMVFNFKLSGDSPYSYIESLEKTGKSYYNIAEKMKMDGLLNNLKVKDLQTNFSDGYYNWILVIIFTLGWYLIAIHIIYRTIAYIFAGRTVSR